jgi:hypothetical protein
MAKCWPRGLWSQIKKIGNETETTSDLRFDILFIECVETGTCGDLWGWQVAGSCSGDNHRVVHCVPWRLLVDSFPYTWLDGPFDQNSSFSLSSKVDGKRKANGADDEEISRRPSPLNFSTSNRSVVSSSHGEVDLTRFKVEGPSRASHLLCAADSVQSLGCNLSTDLTLSSVFFGLWTDWFASEQINQRGLLCMPVREFPLNSRTAAS